jgi:hypothetical protein
MQFTLRISASSVLECFLSAGEEEGGDTPVSNDKCELVDQETRYI